MAAFEFFNERRSDQENGEHNEKLHGGEATESESSHYLLSRLSPMNGVLHSVSHECLLQKQVAQPQLQEHPDRSSGLTVSWIVGARGCASPDLKCSRHRPTHWSPHSFAAFP